MIQDFEMAKALSRALAKKHNLRNLEDWINFTKSKHFKQFENVLPKDPETYYSKENVQKRRQSRND